MADWDGFKVLSLPGDDSMPAPRRDRLSANEAGLARHVALTPDEQAESGAAWEEGRSSRELDAAINDARRKGDSKALAALTDARDGPNPFNDAPRGVNPRPADQWAGFKVVSQPKAPDLSPDALKKTASGDYFDAIGKGFSDLGTSLQSAKWVATGQGTPEIAKALADQIANNNASAGEREILDATKAVNDAKGGWDTAKSIGGLVWSFVSNPYDAGKMVAQQLPNAVPSMGAAAAGAGAGGLIGGPVGAVAGGLTGLAAGSGVVEFGAKLSEKVGEALAGKPPTPENIQAILERPGFRDEAMKEGAAKGITVGAIDALSSAVGGRIATAPFRAATKKALAREGIDLADTAAVNAALKTAPMQAAIKAEMAAISTGRKVGMGAAGVATDSTLEGMGEYAGEYAATGQGKLGDAILEGITSLGQSTAEVAGSAAFQRSRGMIGGTADSAPAAPPRAEHRRQAVQDIATAPDVDSAIEAFGRATAPAATPVEFDRLGALGLLNSPLPTAPEIVGPQYPLSDPSAIPYDYSTPAQRYPQLPAPDMATGSGTLINDTDPQLTRPEQFGDREARINATQRAREEYADAPGVRDIVQTPEGPRRRQRVTLDEAGNVLDAPDGDRQFLSLVRREARPHAAAAIEAHAINPDLTEAALAAPDMGPKAERTVFEAIINGNPADQQTRALLTRYGIQGRLADANGQGAQPGNPPASGKRTDDQRQLPAGLEQGGGGASRDNRQAGVGPFQIRGKWPHDMQSGMLGIIAKQGKSMVERAVARAELDRRNPNRELDRAAHDARKNLWRKIVRAGGISESEANELGIDPRILGGYRMSGFITPRGMQADGLAELLHGEGYLNDVQMADDADGSARQLVVDLLAREFVGRPEERDLFHELIGRHHDQATIADAGMDALPTVDRQDVADYDDSVVAEIAEEVAAELDAGTNMTEADAMRALGFTEQEINDAGALKTAVQEVAPDAGQDEPGSPESGGGTGVEQGAGSVVAARGEEGDRQGETAVAERPALDLTGAAPEPKFSGAARLRAAGVVNRFKKAAADPVNASEHLGGREFDRLWEGGDGDAVRALVEKAAKEDAAFAEAIQSTAVQRYLPGWLKTAAPVALENGVTPKIGEQGAAKPLYASRPVTNAADIIAWAQSQGFKTTLPAGDLHVTVAYSTAPVDGAIVPTTDKSLKVLGDKRTVEPLGDGGAVVLKFTSKALQARWQAYRDAGASWDYEGYTPHITLTYDGQGVDLSKVEPYRGPINLGPETQEPLNEDKADEYVEEPTGGAETKTPAGETKPSEPAAAAPAQEKGAAEPVSRETDKDAPLASRGAPPEAVEDMFGYADADEAALLLDMDERERAKYEKTKPRSMSWPDYAKQRYEKLNADFKGGRPSKPTISATYGADSPWQDAARARDGDALRALRSEAAKLEKDAPAYLYINEDGTAQITVFDARDVPKGMLAFAARNNLKVDVVVNGDMVGAGAAIPAEYRAAGAKYAQEMAKPVVRQTMASRRTPGKGDSRLSAAVTLLADIDGLFQQPTPTAKTLTSIAAEIAPSYAVDKLPPSSARLKNAKEAWRINLPNSYRGAELYDDGQDVWINVSRLMAGQDAGTRIYGMAAAYAHNNGKVFIGDPDDLSRAAYYRRTENMLSSALKFGTTDHLEPHQGQTNAKVFYGDQHPEFAEKTTDILWMPGDTPNNLRELLRVSYTNVSRQVAAVKDIRYDFAKRAFVGPAGRNVDGTAGDASGTREFTDDDFDRIAREARGKAGPGAPGRATLKRAALFATLSRESRGDGWVETLAALGRELSGGLSPALARTFYSREQQPERQSKPAERPGLSVAEVQRIAQGISTRLVRVVQSTADLPEAAARFKSDEGGIRGVFIPATDEIYLIADNLHSPVEVAFVVLHEGAHRGLRAFFGRDIQPILNQIALTNRNVSKLAAEYQAKYDIERMEAIEEVLADMALQGTASDLKGWEKLVSFIQKWATALADKLGFQLKFTDDMVQMLVGAAARRGLQDEATAFDDGVAAKYSEAHTAAMAKPNLDPDDARALLVQQAIEGRTPIEAARWIATTASPSERIIAEKVLRKLEMLKAAGVKLKLHVVHVGDTVPAALTRARGLTQYKFPQGGAATIDVWLNGADVTGKVGVDVDTVLHELVHAATMASVRLGNMRAAAGTQLAKDVGDLYDVSKAVIRHFNQRVSESQNGGAALTAFEGRLYRGSSNAFTTPDETLAWALSDLEAQAYLEGIPYQGRSAWTAFVEAIRKLLGIPAKADTALSEVLRVAEAILSDNINEMIGVANITGSAMARQDASDAMEARQAPRDANQPPDGGIFLPTASRLSDQLAGMNKDADKGLFDGAPELDRPLTDTQARKAYQAMFDKLGQEGLGGLAYNWNESEINEDGDLKNYSGRDRAFTAKGQGGRYRVSKADFVRWLMSDAPLDPAKLQQDDEWRAEVNAARQASGLQFDGAPELDGGMSFRDRQTSSPAFKRWFGDSKVVDPDGKPLVVYHGTRFDFEQFDGYENVGWFSEDPALANGRYAYGESDDAGPNVMPVYLSIKKPLDLVGKFDADDTMDAKSVYAAAGLKAPDNALVNGEWFTAPAHEFVNKAEFADAAKDAGYDGIKITEDGRTTWAAFESAQIKSAIGNNGNFDPNEPSVLASRGTMFDESTAEPATPEETRTRLDSLKDSVRGVALGGFTRNQLADMYGKDITEVADYNRLSADMDAMRANLAQDADRVLQGWRKLDRKTADSVADIMHEATLGQYDPDTGKKGDDFGLPTAIANGMKARFDALPDAAKEVYRRARDMHNDRLRTLFDTLAARIQRSGADPEATRRTIDQLRQQYDKHLAKGPYFPLARFGDYLLIAERKEKTGADDDRMVMSFESAAARDKQASIMRMKGYKTKATVAKAYSRAKDGAAGPLAEAMTDAIQKLDMDRLDLVAEGGKNLGDVKSQLLDELNQALIRGLPELSYRKHFMHRKGTPGFSKDAMRAFADSQLHAANHIARLEYGDQLVRKLNDLQENITEATEGDLTAAQQVANEMVKRHEVAMNHVTHPAAAMLGQLGFVMSLGASIASGVVNLTQTPLVTYPWLASKYGWGKASAALAKAAKDYGRSPWEWESGLNAAKNERLSVDQRAMLKTLEDKGKINTTLAHDLAGTSSADNLNQFSKYGSAWQRTMRLVGWTFHVPEVANRQVTALATYDLARQAGDSHEAAMDAASKAIDSTHFDYSGSNRARYFEGNFRRVILMFKQYGQNIAYLYGRAGYQAFKGATKEEKVEARRMLAGMLTVQFAAAGALGLPFVGGAVTVFAALAQGFGGDDEKWDWEVEFRKWLASTVGKDAGEALSHGLPRLALGWDIAGRIGQNDLFIRAPKKEQEGRDAYFAWMQALAGPVAGYALNGYLGVSDIAKGVSTMNGGMMMRGVEELMPAAIRNPLKAARFEAEDGLRTRSGEKQLELDGFEKLGQAMGFTPTRVSEMYEGLSAIKNKQHGIEVRRKELLDQLAAARQDKDLKGVGDARQSIREFNQRNPRSAITSETIQRSATSRGKREQNMRDGISLPRRQEYLRQEGAFANL